MAKGERRIEDILAYGKALGTVEGALRSLERTVSDGFERQNGRLNSHGDRISGSEKKIAWLIGIGGGAVS